MHTHSSPTSRLPAGLRTLFALAIWTGSGLAGSACEPIEVPDDPVVATDNKPPVFEEVAGTPEATEGKPFSLTVQATDPEGGQVTYGLKDAPAGAVIDSQGVISWTPLANTKSYGETAAFNLLIEATDDAETPATTVYTLAMVVLNDEDGDGQPDTTDDDDDGDGLSDTSEGELGTNPGKADTDDDGVDDDDDNCPTVENNDQINSDTDSLGDACDPDDDDDGKDDGDDNCRTVANGDQLDTDDDGDGDACDDDDDGDTVADGPDNCPLVPNTDQLNSDGDGEGGDACDPNDDNDAWADVDDNCPLEFQTDQLDTDDDGKGDLCDDDDDGDSFPDSSDNCPKVAQENQSDIDEDGVGDACDPCPEDKGLVDDDDDGYCGDKDNCPGVSNPNQLDTNNDGEGDACDLDIDGDGVPNVDDNCPTVENLDQADCDGDDIGNVCDPDSDNDTVLDAAGDNCPCVQNTDQANHDNDEFGDACDDNDDNDAWLDDVDNCPTVGNDDQKNSDDDGLGDACDPDDDNDLTDDGDDNCPLTPNPGQVNSDDDELGDACDPDDDNDGLADEEDNCPTVANAPAVSGEPQADQDSDGSGDACDDDIDGDGLGNGDDNCPLVANPATDQGEGLVQLDVDGDGVGAACDPMITIPEDAWGGGADLNVDGRARAGTVAITFRGDCGGSQCADPGAFVLEAAGYATTFSEWLSFIPSGGALMTPWIGADAMALLAGREADGTIVTERVLGGNVLNAINTLDTDLPVLRDGPDGATFAEITDGGSRRLYSLVGTNNAVLRKSADAFVDEGGTGVVQGGDDVLYYPTNTDDKYTLTAFKPDGSIIDLFNGNTVSLRFLEADSADQTPWYCARKFSSGATPLELQRFDDGFIKEKQSFAGANLCSDIQAVRTPSGVWWLSYPSGTTLTPTVAVWNPATTGPPATITMSCPTTLYSTGDGVFAVEKCPNDSYTFHNTLNATTKSTWISTSSTAFSLKITARNGWFSAAYRQSKTGSSPVKVTVGSETSFDSFNVVSGSQPTINDLQVTDEGVTWVLVLGDLGEGTKTVLFSVTPGGVTTQQFVTAGFAQLAVNQTPHLLWVNGSQAGIYQVQGATTTKLVDAVVNANPPPRVIGRSADALFIAYRTASSWAIGRITNSGGTPSLTAVLTELTGPPLEVYAGAEADELWFPVDRASGRSLAHIVGGALDVTITDAANLVMVTHRPEASLGLATSPVLWGVRHRGVTGDPWIWCELAATSCWEMPTGAFLNWAAVDPGGTVHAVYFDGQPKEAILWRNLLPPAAP